MSLIPLALAAAEKHPIKSQDDYGNSILGLDQEYSTLHRAIEGCIDWVKSDEGPTYWKVAHDAALYGILDHSICPLQFDAAWSKMFTLVEDFARSLGGNPYTFLIPKAFADTFIEYLRGRSDLSDEAFQHQKNQ